MAATRGATTGGPRPVNIVLILTDQLRYDALSCAGNRVVHTPALDRLASQGARFTQATCAAPLCGPSRASLLTGQYRHGHRCPGNAEVHEPGMPEDAVTADEALRAAGRHVEYHGKWHTGSANRGCYADGLPDYLELYDTWLTGRHGPPAAPGDGQGRDRYTGRTYRRFAVDEMMLRAPERGFAMPHHNEAGEYSFGPEDSLTAWTAGRTIDFLRSRPPGPFCVTCSILHPHAPLIATRPYSTMYDPARMPMPATLSDVVSPERNPVPGALPLSPEGLGTFISLYYGLVKEVDDHVGRLLDVLDDQGLAEDTLVVFTSDHGEMMGDHGRVSKMVFYEASLRVPLLMRLPGRIPAGAVLDAPASGVDLAPTLLDYAGVPGVLEAHGRSLRPLIEGGPAPRSVAYAELAADPLAPLGQRIVRSREWKLAFWKARPFLYDLAADPLEESNLLTPGARSPRALDAARRLKGEMLGLMEETGNPDRDFVRGLEL